MTLAGLGVVIGFKPVRFVDCRASEGESRVSLAVAMQIKAFSRTILVLNAGNLDVGNSQRNTGAKRMTFGRSVAVRNGKIDRDLDGTVVRVFARVEQSVHVRSMRDVVELLFGSSLLGIHTNTSFLKVRPDACARWAILLAPH